MISDGKPVVGASVLLQEFDGNQLVIKTIKTGAEGDFDFGTPAPIPSDTPEIAKKRAEYGVTLIVFAPGCGVVQKRFPFGEPMVVTLPKERILRGTVVDAAGKPVAGVPVLLSDVFMDEKHNDRVGIPESLADQFTVKTNQMGTWELHNVPEGANTAWVTINDPRFVHRTVLLSLTNPDAKGYRLITAPGGAVSGRVTHADGKPVEGVRVSASRTNREIAVGSFERVGNTVTGVDGAFRINQLGAGTFSVSLDARKQELVAAVAKGVVVAEGKETPLEMPIKLTPGGRVSGTVVVKGTNKPVANAMVYAADWSSSVRTSDDGKFTVQVAPGESLIHIGSKMEGLAYYDPAQPVTVREGETKTISPFELTPTFTVTLKVSDESGKPVADLPVRVYHPGWSDGTESDQYARTDAHGVWDSKNDRRTEFGTDAKVGWEIRLPTGWEVVSPKTLSLPSPTSVNVVVRKPDPASRPHGRVVTPDGKPVSGVNVSVSSWFIEGDNSQRDYQSQNNVSANADGTFVLAPLRPNATVRLTINKGEHRLAEPMKRLTVPADGKQPDYGDIVLIPLNGSVSGVVVGAGGKPVPSAWVWSLAGSARATTRTDAKGQFMLQGVPGRGAIPISVAFGTVTASYTISKGEANRLNLTPAPPRKQESLKLKVERDRKKAFEIIAEMKNADKPGQGVRSTGNDRDGGDTLAGLLAPFDLDAALRIGADTGGTISEPVLSDIISKSLRASPERARLLFVTDHKKWTNPYQVFWRSVEMATLFTAKDPTFADACYEMAKKQISSGIPEDALWETLALSKLAYYRNAPDADFWEKRAITLTTKESGGNDMAGLAWAAREIATGDGIRTAKLLDRVSADKRSEVAIGILTGMTAGEITPSTGDSTIQPLQAGKLWEKWFSDGTIKKDYDRWRYGDSGRIAVQIAKATAQSDPDAAYRIAQQASQNERWIALLYAASGQKDSTVRVRRYREAVDDDRTGYGKISHYAEAAYVAGRTGDAAFVAEMRKALAKSLVGGFDTFSGNPVENAFRITLVFGNDSPDMCRFYIESALREARQNNPEVSDEVWLYKPAIQAMALIDLPRALEITRSFRDAKDQAQGKRDIIRTLLTHPTFRHSLIGDPRF